MNRCVYCNREVNTKKHHLIPKSKGGEKTVDACMTCEEYIHRTWDHNQLRNVFNTVEAVRNSDKYQKFLKWLLKQPIETGFKTKRSKDRTKHKYR